MPVRAREYRGAGPVAFIPRKRARLVGKTVGYATRSPALVLYPGTGRRGRGVRGYTRRVGFYGRYNRRNRGGGPGSELKFHDVTADEAVQDLSGGIIVNTSSINLIPQGVTEIQRIGRKCTIKSINYRYTLTQIATAAATLGAGQTVRIMIVLDKQCNGAAPTVSGTGGVLETATFQSFRNLASGSRFWVLMDRTHNMNIRAAAGDGAANDSSAFDLTRSFYKKVNIPIEFNAATGAIAEIRTNNLFILLINSTASSFISLASRVRLRFEG